MMLSNRFVVKIPVLQLKATDRRAAKNRLCENIFKSKNLFSDEIVLAFDKVVI